MKTRCSLNCFGKNGGRSISRVDFRNDDGFDLGEPFHQIKAEWRMPQFIGRSLEMAARSLPQTESRNRLAEAQLEERCGDLDQPIEKASLGGFLLQVNPDLFPRFVSFVIEAVVEEVDTAKEAGVFGEAMITVGGCQGRGIDRGASVLTWQVGAFGQRKVGEEEGEGVHARIIPRRDCGGKELRVNLLPEAPPGGEVVAQLKGAYFFRSRPRFPG